jgi:hypothetical protein
MRRAILLAVLATACEWPTAEYIPPSARPIGYPAPGEPGMTATVQLLVVARNGVPTATDVHLVLGAEARILDMGLAVTPADSLSDSIVVTSDARGRASAVIRFGSRAGRAAIRTIAPVIGFDDSLVYDLPDGPVNLLDIEPVAPPYPGETVAVRWRAFSGPGRPVFSQPVLDVADTGIATFAGQDRIRARRTGETWIRIREGAVADSVPLAVVPPGTFGAIVANQWVEVPTRGTPQTKVRNAFLFSGPRYSPSGDTLAFTEGNAIRLHLPGGGSTLLAPAALGLYALAQPAWSADAQWIYFTAFLAQQQAEIWRVRPDGSGAERVGPTAAAGEVDQSASVSADGQLLAYVTNRTLSGGLPTVRILDLVGGTVRFSGQAGSAPQFAPDGSRMAYVSGGGLMLVNADGTGLRQLVPSLGLFSGQLSWSPDGQWILAAQGGSLGVPQYLYLVDADTDTAIRLPYSFSWTSPDWR